MKIITKTKRRQKKNSVNTIKTIATIDEEFIYELPQLQTGSYEGCFYEWAMKSIIEILDHGVVPTGKKIHDFFERYACRVSVYNVPKYINTFQ